MMRRPLRSFELAVDRGEEPLAVALIGYLAINEEAHQVHPAGRLGRERRHQGTLAGPGVGAPDQQGILTGAESPHQL
jgi:hypothetical protein